jgi:hypothetical protein
VTGVETHARPVGGAAATARRTAPAALEWLRSARPARALHVFDRAAYLIDDRGGLVLLAAPPVPMGPFAVMANLPASPFGEWMKVGDPAVRAHGLLTVGGCVVRFDAAMLWPPTPAWRAIRARARSWAAQLPEIRQVLRQQTRRGIFADIAGDGATPEFGLGAALAMRARSGAAALLEALSGGDVGRLPRTAAGLAGLGTGFTPSGDDFLMGTMFALWATRPSNEARRTCELILRSAAPRTTRASAAWLAAAARGEAAEPWHGLFASLAGGDPGGVRAAARRIVQTGHTSGEDALIGFISAAASLSDSPARRAAPKERSS